MEERSKLDHILAPTKADRQRVHELANKIGYYVLILIISVTVLLLVPFISGGINGDFQLYFPKSTIGWIVYWIIRVGTAILNVAIFALFKLQAKQNIKNDPEYIEAMKQWKGSGLNDERKPRSPKKMEVQEWSIKGVTILITSLLAGATISSLILSFDIMTFLSCLTSVIMGLCFGYVAMRKNEIYWTEEFPEYVRNITKQESQKEKENEQNA